MSETGLKSLPVDNGSLGLDREGVRQDMTAFWDVYRDAADSIRESILQDLSDDAALGPIVDTVGANGSDGDAQRLMARGFETGDWEPYLEQLREQGVAYGREGLEFDQWFRLVGAFRPKVVPHLVKEYHDEPETLEAAIRGMGLFLDLALSTIGQAYLTARERTIEKQRLAISELSTPVLQIRPGLLLLPIVGILDTARSRQLTEQLLYAIQDNRARVVVMDITGVVEVDTEVANRLVQAADAARLMGTTPILTGIASGVAQTLVALGVDLKGLRTVGDLQGGIEAGHRILGVRVVNEETRAIGTA